MTDTPDPITPEHFDALHEQIEAVVDAVDRLAAITAHAASGDRQAVHRVARDIPGHMYVPVPLHERRRRRSVVSQQLDPGRRRRSVVSQQLDPDDDGPNAA